MVSVEEHDANGAQDFLTGKLLIAMPNMGDPRFERSLIYICAHDETHAMGVIVNKPIADVEMTELLRQLEIAPAPMAIETPVYYGGPVQTDRGLVLHTLDYNGEATLALSNTMGITASRDVLVDIAGANPGNAPPHHYRLAIGHAGWGAGQLESEIAMNAWAHCDPDDAIIFNSQDDEAWRSAFEKLGVTGAMLSPEWSAVRDDDHALN